VWGPLYTAVFIFPRKKFNLKRFFFGYERINKHFNNIVVVVYNEVQDLVTYFFIINTRC
jgi:hypothetical protein